MLDPSAGYRAFLDGSQIDPTQQWNGRKVNIFYSASIIWGAIGPIKFFSGKYVSLFWFFLYGAIAPVVPWLLNKRYPRKWWKLVHFPVMLYGAGVPPQTPTNIIIGGFTVAWLSQSYARRHHPKWFARRNYVLASALDAGSSVNAQVYMRGRPSDYDEWDELLHGDNDNGQPTVRAHLELAEAQHAARMIDPERAADSRQCIEAKQWHGVIGHNAELNVVDDMTTDVDVGDDDGVRRA